MSGPTKSTASYRPPPVAEWAGPEAPSARLVVVEGPDSGRSVELGGQAVTIGADADCALRLSDAGGQVGGRHARVWLREGSFMLHHLDRRLTTRVGERTVDWAVLEPMGTRLSSGRTGCGSRRRSRRARAATASLIDHCLGKSFFL